MGGFTHLLNTFTKLDIKRIETNLTIKCIEVLIFVLFDFIQSEQELIKQVLEQKEAVILQCIHLIDCICEYTLVVEKNRGVSYEEINKRIQ